MNNSRAHLLNSISVMWSNVTQGTQIPFELIWVQLASAVWTVLRYNTALVLKNVRISYSNPIYSHKLKLYIEKPKGEKNPTTYNEGWEPERKKMEEKLCPRKCLDYEISQKNIFLTIDTFYRKWAIIAGWLCDPQKPYYKRITAPVGSYRFNLWIQTCWRWI